MRRRHGYWLPTGHSGVAGSRTPAVDLPGPRVRCGGAVVGADQAGHPRGGVGGDHQGLMLVLGALSGAGAMVEAGAIPEQAHLQSAARAGMPSVAGSAGAGVRSVRRSRNFLWTGERPSAPLPAPGLGAHSIGRHRSMHTASGEKKDDSGAATDSPTRHAISVRFRARLREQRDRLETHAHACGLPLMPV